MKNERNWQDLVDRAEARRQELIAQASRQKADLPLKFLRQQAHFTTPASDLAMATKAVENGLSATPKILEKFGITLNEVSDRLQVPLPEIEAVLGSDPRSPLVMIDGEDAQALRDDVVARGRENAIKVFTSAQWGRTLRFYRPSGMNLPYCVQDLVTVFSRVGESDGRTESDRAGSARPFPIDGIIFPKVEHPAELQWVDEILAGIESRLGLATSSIKVQFLVEGGWAALQLPELVKPVMPRLAGIIFGIADYSADIGLPAIVNDHPVCDLARGLIVNMAGALGVPSIDNMTVNYPVADKALDAQRRDISVGAAPNGNKEKILARLKECFDDARHGFGLGMDGKWVGHPAQLFACLLAYRSALPQKEIDTEVAKIEAYQKAVAAEQGATIIEGVMSDRATDRHARMRLRKAVAYGRLDPKKALSLGVITQAEANQVTEG